MLDAGKVANVGTGEVLHHFADGVTSLEASHDMSRQRLARPLCLFMLLSNCE